MPRYINYRLAKEDDIKVDMYCWRIDRNISTKLDIIDNNDTINPVFSLYVTEDNIEDIKESVRNDYELVLIK